ncbi:hypothetical protein R1521_31075 [Rhizobium brockwellii]|uniref:Uncharacterized protein n=1 Tax=Rhizobium brockwellii TaxID=3019932 RepID=A0ABU3YVJ0_9HYPH|nr:hypothetical protein [Rhizobium brockwellii]MDV4182960.1 hypothetical protein [Rhizobium brockwellii]MDV4189864.1 hypothetical protein [Rhizobium brockwellii]
MGKTAVLRLAQPVVRRVLQLSVLRPRPFDLGNQRRLPPDDVLSSANIFDRRRLLRDRIPGGGLQKVLLDVLALAPTPQGAGRFIREPTRLMKHKWRPVIKKRCHHRCGIVGDQQTTMPIYLSRSNGPSIMRVLNTCALPVFRARSCRFKQVFISAFHQL